MSGSVVESFLGDSWALDADLLLDELWSSSILAYEVLLEDLGTSEECAVSLISPLVDDLLGSFSDLASWDVVFGEGVWDVDLLELEELTALLSVWGRWVDVNFFLVVGPFTSLESLPLVVLVFVYVTIVMPESLIPGPVVFKTLLGWTPVVIFITIPLVPDTLLWVPLPGLSSLWLGMLVAPVADSWVVLVVVYEIHAGSLGLEDVFVLSIDSSFSLSEVLLDGLFGVLGLGVKFTDSSSWISLELNKRHVELVHVLAQLSHLGELGVLEGDSRGATQKGGHHGEFHEIGRAHV